MASCFIRLRANGGFNQRFLSKDADFVQSFWFTGEPKLLLISTGNISNAELEKILRANLSGIATAFVASRFVEITRDALVVHE
jgi:predicted nuclease of predicted toxin-antitoxin system